MVPAAVVGPGVELVGSVVLAGDQVHGRAEDVEKGGFIAFGEVGLSGEIRPVPNGEERLREAATHGFKRAIVPKGNAPKSGHFKGLEVIAVERLSQALEAAAD